MTNIGATLKYRAAIAAAIKKYGLDYRAAFERYGAPIPADLECAGAMINAWGTCRVAFKLADLTLDADRRTCMVRPDKQTETICAKQK